VAFLWLQFVIGSKMAAAHFFHSFASI